MGSRAIDTSEGTTTDTCLNLPGAVSMTITNSTTQPNPLFQKTYTLKNYHGDTALVLTTEGKTNNANDPSSNNLRASAPFGESLIPGTTGSGTNSTPNSSTQQMTWAANPTRKDQSTSTNASGQTIQLFSIPLIQMGARVYLPTVGRFLQTDPIEGGTLNPYVYAHDPVNLEDYSGRGISWSFFFSPYMSAPTVTNANNTWDGLGQGIALVRATITIARSCWNDKWGCAAVGAMAVGTAILAANPIPGDEAAAGAATLNKASTLIKNGIPYSGKYTQPGFNANGSVASPSTSQRFTTSIRAQVNAIGDSFGCHSCGSSVPKTVSGNWVPDHQPISSLNFSNSAQELYPQCLACSYRQGGEASSILRDLGL